MLPHFDHWYAMSLLVLGPRHYTVSFCLFLRGERMVAKQCLSAWRDGPAACPMHQVIMVNKWMHQPQKAAGGWLCMAEGSTERATGRLESAAFASRPFECETVICAPLCLCDY